MATGDQFDVVRPLMMQGDTGFLGAGRLRGSSATSPNIGGVPLSTDTQGYEFISRIPANGTPLPTGLTFGVQLVDDPNNPNASGAVRIGITVKRIVSGTDDTTSGTSASAETLTTITMPSTTGVAILTSIAIANAALDSIAASDSYIVRIRRKKSDALDTHTGTVLLTLVTVRDT
jgi:hypothetical protein